MSRSGDQEGQTGVRTGITVRFFCDVVIVGPAGAGGVGEKPLLDSLNGGR